MDVGFDLVRELLVVIGHGEGDLEPGVERDGLIVELDLLDGDGSFQRVGETHGESPEGAYGGSSCVFSSIPAAKSLPWGPNCGEAFLPILGSLPRIALQLASAR